MQEFIFKAYIFSRVRISVYEQKSKTQNSLFSKI